MLYWYKVQILTLRVYLQTRIDSIAQEAAGVVDSGKAADLPHSLATKKALAVQEKAALEARLARDELLSSEEQQQLVELEERLEALDMEMEYKTDYIAQLQSSLVQQQRAEEVYMYVYI